MARRDKDTGQNESYLPTPEDRVIVALLAGEGTPQRAICRFVKWTNNQGELVPIAYATLKRHFRDELRQGREIADAEIVSANYKLMRAGNPQVTMFLAKARLGWKEVTEVHMRESYGDLVKQSAEKAEQRREQAKLAVIQGGKPDEKVA